VVTVVIGAVVAALLGATVYGRYLHAMGQSRMAAELSGIRVRRMIVYNFMLAGLLGATVGVLLAAYDGGAFQNIGDVYLLGSVAAVVVGGVPISGGKSSVPATLLGALVMTLLITLLEVSKLSVGLQDVLEGIAVIVIVVAAQLGRARRA
jgi:ribose transport system permease protein